MNTSTTHRRHRTNAGVTLIEALLVLGVLTTIATLAYTIISSTLSTSRESKLKQQVAVLNASAAMFHINGGYLDPFATSTEIFQTLQTSTTDAETARTVGTSGSMVDPNLIATPTSEEETEDPDITRVVWMPELNRFAISNETKEGIMSFHLDSQGASTRVVNQKSRLRKGAVKYAAVDDWVWDFAETPITYGSPDYLVGGDWVGNPGSTPPATPSDVLAPPLISIPGSTYPITSYPLVVTLANPNPPNSSDVYYSVNQGPVQLYNGETLNFTPGEAIAARTEPRTEDWKTSNYNVAYYHASPVKLTPPIIRATAPQFDPVADPDIFITLDNPNDSQLSTIEYRANGGDWIGYDGNTFRLSLADYPSGVLINARAQPTPTATYYLTSDTATRDIGILTLTNLAPPVIAFSAPQFSDEVDEIDVILENPNPQGSSDIYYTITEPESLRDETVTLQYFEYSDTFNVTSADYPSGFAIIAYAHALDYRYRDSIPAEDEVGVDTPPDGYDPTDEIGIAGGHFDIDTSSFIAEFGNGTTDGHVHEYDNKYHTAGAEFFDLQGDVLHNITDDIGDGETFKIIIVNPDLSPGARLVINRDYDDRKPSTWINAQDYANIPIDRLPIFNFEGKDGAIPLYKLGLYFDVDAIKHNEILPTDPVDVRANVPGKNGEWRNGALTIQAVKVKKDGEPEFTTSTAISAGGVHGGALSGLFWEANLYWHHDGTSYDEPENEFDPDPRTPGTTTLTNALFSGESGGFFYNPTGQADMITNLDNGVRDSYFEWGDSVNALNNGSNIKFTSKDFENIGLDQLFEIGEMEFENDTIWDGSDARHVHFDLELEIELQLRTFGIATGTYTGGGRGDDDDDDFDEDEYGDREFVDLSETLKFAFDLISTPNRSYQTADENADYFTFGNFQSDFTTTVNGVLYGLSLQFGEVDNDGFTTIHAFHTHEGKKAKGSLYGSFYTIDPVDLLEELMP